MLGAAPEAADPPRGLTVPCRVEAPDPLMASRLERLFGHVLVESDHKSPECVFRLDRAAGMWRLHRGGLQMASAADPEDVLVALASEVNRTALDRCPHLAIHAGVVAAGGAAVALAGVSGAGKSTLTAACIAAGWDYVSDEALCLRADGFIDPYPRPVALSRDSLDLLGLAPTGDAPERLLAVEDMGGRSVQEPLRLAEVVFIERRPGVGAASLVARHRSEALTGLLPLAFNHYKDPAARIRLLAEVALTCRIWRLRYDDARQAARLLRETFLR